VFFEFKKHFHKQHKYSILQGVFLFILENWEAKTNNSQKERKGIMTKFGELINLDIPVLIDFYFEWDKTGENPHEVLRDVVAALGDKAKVIKIDIEKNEILADALKVKANPTFIIYKEGVMKWRQSGDLDANTLITLVEKYA